MYSETLGITIFVFVASALLSGIITVSYLRTRQQSALFWSLGMWLFAVSVLLEIIFAYGLFTEILIDVYLFLVALLVQFLSLGSIMLRKPGRVRNLYWIYSIATDVFLVAALAMTHTGNIIKDGVVSGNIPMLAMIGSVLITFPAAIVLVVVAAISFKNSRNPRMLSIILGTIVVSVAGTLYIAAFPSFLYLAELIGILLLWIGFVNFSVLFKHMEVSKHVNS